MTTIDQLGSAERYDIVVDFSSFQIGCRIRLVNQLRMRDDGRGPQEDLTLAQALAGDPDDPCIGPIMEFRVVSSVRSVDNPNVTLFSTSPDNSRVPAVLTQQIPIVAPVRTRLVEWGDRATATRATRSPASARPIARRTRSSRGPSGSTGRRRIR